MEYLVNALTVGLVLGLLVFIHEFGHYAAAKLCGVRVEVFSIGFGKRLLGFKRNETDYRLSVLPGEHTKDPLTLLALRLNGEVLDLDHGYPARIIAPSRPGVLQTKWVSRLEVL